MCGGRSLGEGVGGPPLLSRVLASQIQAVGLRNRWAVGALNRPTVVATIQAFARGLSILVARRFAN